MKKLGKWLRPRLTPSQIWMLVGGCVAVVVVVLAWKIGPLRVWGDPARVSLELARFRMEPWAPFAMLALYVIAAVVCFPVLVLIAATALTFEPWLALLIAMSGALVSTSVLYSLGALSMRRPVPAAVTRAVQRIDALLRGRDVLAVMFVRMLPVAPSSLVSVSLGVLGIPLRDALLGTALGMAPGMLALVAFGRQLRAVIEHPSLLGVGVLGGLLLGWIGLAVVLQKIATAREDGREDPAERELAGDAPDPPSVEGAFDAPPGTGGRPVPGG
jgi:phospholipase D1/2